MKGSQDSSTGEQTGECSDQTTGNTGKPPLLTDGGEPRKIVGEIDEEDATGVHGKATGDGETYGVKGEADSEEGYGLYTPDDAKVEGTVATDDELEVYVGNDRGLELEQATRIFSFDPVVELQFIANGNVVFGHLNEIDEDVMGGVVAGGGSHDVNAGEKYPNVVEGDFGTVSGGEGNVAGDPDDEDATHGTVGGGYNNEASGESATAGGGSGNEASGRWATVGGGRWNEASGNRATVGGGISNIASGNRATVGGGNSNAASGRWATVGGGTGNEASGNRATVPGGRNNTADGDYSFAAGRRADTDGHDGAIVFADSSDDFIEADADDTAFFQMPIEAPEVKNSSARALKTDIDPVDPADVLDGVESLDVSTWRFDSQDTGLHMGPMAGEFAETFGLGDDDETIATVDADGVALAAIQGLSQKLDERDRRIEALEARNDDLEARLTALEQSSPQADAVADDD